MKGQDFAMHEEVSRIDIKFHMALQDNNHGWTRGTFDNKLVLFPSNMMLV